MSTLENLFMQIFDRRTWIVDHQLKPQQQSYEQSLASHLLISGIRPPSWLWNSTSVGSDPENADPRELKKEELISGLLFPPPRPPPVPLSAENCARYRKWIVKEDNKRVSDCLAAETCDSNNFFDAMDRSMAVPKSSLSGVELGQKHNVNGVPELDPISTSPIQTGAQVPDIHSEADKLPPVLKSFVNCNDGNEVGQKCISNKAPRFNPVLPSEVQTEAEITETCFESDQLLMKSLLHDVEVGKSIVNEVPQPNPISISPQVQMDAKNGEISLETDVSLLRFQRSRSRQKALECRNSAKAEAKKHPREENITSEYSGRVARSRAACKQPTCVMESSSPNSFSELIDKNDVTVMPRRSTTAELHSADVPLRLEKPLNQVAGNDPQKELGTDMAIESEHAVDNVIQSSNNVNDTDRQLCTFKLVETATVSGVPDANHSVCSELKMVSGNDKVGLGSIVSRPPTDVNTFVEPKQLVFDDIENCGLKLPVGPTSEEEKRSSPLDVRAVSKLPPSQSSKDVFMALDLQEMNDLSTNDLVQDMEMSQAENMVQEKEESLMVELLSREKEAWKASVEGRGEEMFESLEINETEHNISHTFVGCEPSILFDSSSKKQLPISIKKVSLDTLGDMSLDGMSNHLALVTADDPSPLQEGGRKSSSSSHLLRAVDFNLPEIACNLQTGGVAEQKCTGELDVEPAKMLPEVSELRAAASYGPTELAVVDFSGHIAFPYSFKPDTSNTQESGTSSAAADAAKGRIVSQITTPKAAEIQRQQAPYFLRSSTGFSMNLCSSESKGSHGVRKSRRLGEPLHDACETLWPVYKRRKIKAQIDNVYNTSPRLRRTKTLLQIHEDSICKQSGSFKDASKVIQEFQHFSTSYEAEAEQSSVIIESDGVEVHRSKKRQKTKESGIFPMLQSSSQTLQMKKVYVEVEGKDESEMAPVTSKRNHLEAAADICVGKQADGGAPCSSEDGGETVGHISLFNKKKQHSLNDDLYFLQGKVMLKDKSTKMSGHSEETIEEIKSTFGGCGLHPSDLTGSSYYEDLQLLGADKTMPEFEGFNIGVSPEKRLALSVCDGLNFEVLDLASLTTEQASALEQLYTSASMLTPLPPSSTKHKMHIVPDVCQSLPNGILEHTDLRKAHLFDLGDFEQLIGSDNSKVTEGYCSFGGEIDQSFLPRSYSDCMPFSRDQCAWDASRPPYTSPFGKLYERTSSGKRVSRNPELTCFRIDEDTCINQGNGHLDDAMALFQNGSSSRKENISNKKEVLTDVSSKYQNSPSLVPSAPKFNDRASIDSMNKELNSSQMQTQTTAKRKVENGHKNRRRYQNEDKENQSPSIVGNGAGKATENQHDRFSRPKLSRKASEKKGNQTLLEKGCKPTNIVSNISSFVPLVQQKQEAAAALPGKRDIKVKALEAAEAAKRLEEKRDNERKMRKEAAKLERAKLEIARQLELKKKEEERKKKEVDMAARKRQRELKEEERREKERKRKCIEETRRQQKEHEEKLRAEKEEKELRRKADEERNRKELAEEARKHQKREKGREGAGCMKRMEVEVKTADVMMGNTTLRSNSEENHGAFKGPNHVGKVASDSDNLHKGNEDGMSITEGSQVLESYEISPYQGSDNEEDDDDDDDMAEKKWIPLWARGKCVAQSLYSLKNVDPTEIFLLERCPRLSEVLLPRKEKQSQVAI